MKIAFYILLALLLLLQYPLWFGNSSVVTLWRLEREITTQKAENARLRERNAALEAEVVDLKNGLAAIEERARAELGMVKKGETFFQIPPQPQNKSTQSKSSGNKSGGDNASASP